MSETAGELFLTKKKFADSQGWSPSYVTKLGHEGKLVLDEQKKRVNVAATLANIRQSADPSKQHVRAIHASSRVHREGSEPVAPPVSADSSNGSYWIAKADREQTLGKLAKLELAKLEGELVSAAEVRLGLEEASRMLRDMIMAVSSRVAPLVAATSDVREVERIVRAELRAVLDNFSRMAAAGLDRAGCAAGEVAHE